MTCRDFRTNINENMNDGRVELRTHPETCAECRLWLAEYKASLHALKNIDTFTAPVDFAARVRERTIFAKTVPAVKKSVFSQLFQWKPALALGLSFAVIVLIGLLFWHPWIKPANSTNTDFADSANVIHKEFQSSHASVLQPRGKHATSIAELGSL